MAQQLPKDLSDGERKFVESLVGKMDSLLFARWVTKMKRNKVQPRLFVIGVYRCYSIKRGMGGNKKVQREGHFFDLIRVTSTDPGYVNLQFKNWQIEIVGDDRIADEIIKILRIVTRPFFYGFPDEQVPQYDVPLERLLPMEPVEPGLGQGIAEIYKAYCNYYNTTVSDSFIQFVEGLCTGTDSKELVLDQITGIELETEYSFNLMPVVAALKHNIYFTSVLLRRVPRRDAVLAFAETFKCNKVIEKLVLTDIEASEGFTELGESLKFNPRHALSHIDFSHNNVKDKGVIGLAAGFEVMMNHLTIVNLSHCGIQSKGIQALMKAFQSNLAATSTIVELNLSHNDISTGGAGFLANWISSLNQPDGKRGSLQKLFLANSNIDVFVVLQAIRNSVLDTLEVLDLSENKLEKIPSQALVFVLENSSCLKSLVLSSCKISPEITFVLLSSASNNPKMTDLEMDLSDNDLGNDGAVAIAKVLPTSTNIHTLKLRNNNFQKDAMVFILKALAGIFSNESIVKPTKENKTLKGIDLSINLKYSSKNGEVYKALFELLQRKTALETLVLNGNEKTYLGKDLAYVFPSLRSNVTLTALDISGNRMGDKAAIDLADSLRVNHSLTHLCWDENFVALGGFQALASCLKTNKKLAKMPLPVSDLEHAVDDAKDKKRFKEKLTEILNHIQQGLAYNRGETSSPPFILPSPADRRLSVRDPARKPSPSISRVPSDNSRRVSAFSVESALINQELLPPPPPPEEDSEIDNSYIETESNRSRTSTQTSLPPPPTPAPF